MDVENMKMPVEIPPRQGSADIPPDGRGGHPAGAGRDCDLENTSRCTAASEMIGRVKLNLDFYPGKDLYSDGEIEQKLLEIVKSHSEEEFDQVIAEEADWAILYHLSHIRQNIVGSVHLRADASVLEIGSGCGAITGALSRQAGSVTCVDLSLQRSRINAYRNRERDNIEILVGNFQDIEKSLGEYDCVTLIGVFEYGAAYIKAADPYVEFLRIIRKHLAPGGKIVMAIENRFGMKYFAGCQEDHFGKYFEGIEGYTTTEGVKTFSGKELERICAEAGFEKVKFYYPYPDYKLPFQVFSDGRLPGTGELTTNLRNFDRDRMLLFDEKKAFDCVNREGMFPFFSNSYLLEISMDDTADANPVIYKKYSNDRAREFSVCTEMRMENGECIVRKEAAFPESAGHVRSLPRLGEALRRQYAGSKLTVCPCVEKNAAAEAPIRPSSAAGRSRDLENAARCAAAVVSPFVSGRTLEEIADEGIGTGQYEKTESIIRELIALIWEKNADRPFQMTEAFTRVFGPAEFEGKMHAGSVSDIDMVLGNILTEGTARQGQDSEWILIDYEWTFEFPVPTEFIIYRMLHYYFETSASRQILKDRDYLKLSKADEQTFRQMEIHFQQYINGTHVPIHELYPVMGKAAVDMRVVMESGEFPEQAAMNLRHGDKKTGSLLRRGVRRLKRQAKSLKGKAKG
ncbi:MAG: methyltransferase domain-containing protein [Clostridiales bacterium]|nr:methyltransferase domain-containing protein [Clostridiales bacterium]